jgi:hypothetical protein
MDAFTIVNPIPVATAPEEVSLVNYDDPDKPGTGPGGSCTIA